MHEETKKNLAMKNKQAKLSTTSTAEVQHCSNTFFEMLD